MERDAIPRSTKPKLSYLNIMYIPMWLKQLPWRRAKSRSLVNRTFSSGCAMFRPLQSFRYVSIVSPHAPRVPPVGPSESKPWSRTFALKLQFLQEPIGGRWRCHTPSISYNISITSRLIVGSHHFRGHEGFPEFWDFA